MQNFGNMLIRFQMHMHNTNYSWKSIQQSNFDRVFCQHIVLIMFYLNPTGTMNYIILCYANYLSYSFIITISWISITKKGESSWSQLDSNEARAAAYFGKTNLPNLAHYLVFQGHFALRMCTYRIITIIQIL